MVLHEGQSVRHRGPRALPEDLPRDRGREECESHAAALSALAAGTATRDDVLALRPHLRHCATCRANVRELRFSRTRRLALLLPFGWLARLLSRSDVGTTIWAASNGVGGSGRPRRSSAFV